MKYLLLLPLLCLSLYGMEEAEQALQVHKTAHLNLLLQNIDQVDEIFLKLSNENKRLKTELHQMTKKLEGMGAEPTALQVLTFYEFSMQSGRPVVRDNRAQTEADAFLQLVNQVQGLEKKVSNWKLCSITTGLLGLLAGVGLEALFYSYL